MLRIIRKYILPAILILQLSDCAFIDPNFYIWKDSQSGSYSKPWSGIDKKPKSQYKTYMAGPMSTIDNVTEYRWKVSAFNKKNSSRFADKSLKYLVTNDILQRWGFERFRSLTYGATPTYEITLISITPMIVTLRPHSAKDLQRTEKDLESPKGKLTLSTKYSYRGVRYGTKLDYQSNLLYFSPDLDILPQPLNLKKGGKTTIYWNRLLKSGAIEFTEKDGTVFTKRIKNKTGKDAKKEPSYNHNYHLKLIDSEKETARKWKEQKDKR